MAAQSTTSKKDKDTGHIVIDKDDFPMCSEHGYSLWIEEKNIFENSAFCMTSDETIEAAPGVKLKDRHISLKKMPPELEEFSALLHDEMEKDDPDGSK